MIFFLKTDEVFVEKVAKEVYIGELKEIFSSTSAAILVDHRGLRANQAVELRKSLKGHSSRFKVLKNTLAKIAAEGTPFEGLRDKFVDTRAIVFSNGDPVGQAKALSEFAKIYPALQIQGGLLANEGRLSVLTEDEIKTLSELPSKEELIAKLLFLMQATASQLVRTLNEVPAKFVRTLSAIADSKN